MVEKISFKCRIFINRPIEEVRAHFMDFAYHAQFGVHKGFQIEVYSQTPYETRFRQKGKIARFLQEDEISIRRLADDSLSAEVLSGTNQGSILRLSFNSTKPGTTQVVAHFSKPIQGVRQFFSRFILLGFKLALEKTLSEDRLDLESGRYHQYLRTSASSISV